MGCFFAVLLGALCHLLFPGDSCEGMNATSVPRKSSTNGNRSTQSVDYLRLTIDDFDASALRAFLRNKSKRNLRRQWCVDRRKVSCARPCRVDSAPPHRRFALRAKAVLLSKPPPGPRGLSRPCSIIKGLSFLLAYLLHPWKRMRNRLNEPREDFIGTCVPSFSSHTIRVGISRCIS